MRSPDRRGRSKRCSIVPSANARAAVCLCASASAARRHDAHQGGVPGGQGAGAHRRARRCDSTSAASARSARNARRRPGEMDDFRAALDFVAGQLPGLPLWAAGFSFGSWIAMERRRRRSARRAAARHRAAGRTATTSAPVRDQPTSRSSWSTANTTSSSRAVTSASSTRELAEPKELVVDRRRGSPVRRQDARSRRRGRRSARAISRVSGRNQAMHRRSHRFGGAHGGRQGAQGHAAASSRPDDMAADGHSPRRCGARPGSRPRTSTTSMLGCAMPEGGTGPERRAHRQPARRRAGRRRRRSPSTASARRGCRRSPTRAERIMLGAATSRLRGGTESMSMIPMGGHKVSPNPGLVGQLSRRLSEHRPRRRESRAAVEDLARGAGRVRARSHQRALAAIEAGRFNDEIVPVKVDDASARTATVKRERRVRHATKVRAATHRSEALGKLRAGVSCDRHGHGRQLVADQRRRGGGRGHVGASTRGTRGLTPLARFVAYATAGVAPELLRHRPGAGDPQGAQAGRADARSTSISSS